MGEGGVHCGSPYLYSMVGKGGIQAQCNLDMLDSMAFTLNGLVGPWILGGDWNCSPQDLTATGWLQKVGGVIHAPTAATSNGSVYDYFVVKKTISDGVQCTCKIGDAGYTPHSPARLIFRGIPRKVMVGQIRAPASIPAVLPHGPMQEPPAEPDDMIELGKTVDESYASFARDTVQMLQQLQGVVPPTGAKAGKDAKWAPGVSFRWKNLADPPASDLTRTTPVSRAWRNTAAWLRVVLANRTEHLTRAAVWKLLHYDHRLQIDDSRMKVAAAEFIAWRSCLSASILEHPTWTKSFLEVATEASHRANLRAATDAARRFEEWIADGRASGLKRQHLLSRTTTGWIPDKCGPSEEVQTSELDDLEGISSEQLRSALAYSPQADSPLAAQDAANSERTAWGNQWAMNLEHDELVWPEESDALPPMSLERFKCSLFSFAAGTGLGWDGVHPRALLRLDDPTLRRWMACMLKCERFGVWPQQVGVVAIVLLPKGDGEFRPIGLFPTIIRIWMRARVCVARAWEAGNALPCLLGGAGSGAQRASRQAAFLPSWQVF